MNLRRSLALSFASSHPAQAAKELETQPAAKTGRFLSRLPPEVAAGVWPHMAPTSGQALLEAMAPDGAARILAAMPLDVAGEFIRRAPEESRLAILDAMVPQVGVALRRVATQSGGSAGALMDPLALSVPQDLTVAEALEFLRREAKNASHNLYVVDQERKLVGVVNTPELLQARSGDRIEAVMNPAGHRLLNTADRGAIIGHSGWREVHSLPVVDAGERFLGALRYRTFRQLATAETAPGVITAQALGDLFWTGISGAIEAVAAGAAPRPRAGSEQRALTTREVLPHGERD